jgi:hypothetical protein
MECIIVAFSESTIHTSRPATIKIFLILFVRVWKYLVSLNIVFVGHLSTRHISYFIGLTCIIYMKQALF